MSEYICEEYGAYVLGLIGQVNYRTVFTDIETNSNNIKKNKKRGGTSERTGVTGHYVPRIKVSAGHFGFGPKCWPPGQSVLLDKNQFSVLV